MENLFFLDYKTIDEIEISKIDNAVLRILKRYSLNKGDYENNELTESIFIRLGWSNRYKDTIFSFFRVFCSAIEIYSNRNCITIEDGSRVIFYGKDNTLKYSINGKKSDKYQYNKSLLFQKATDEVQCLEKTMALVFQDNEMFRLLESASKLSDSLSNFIPHPGYPFNQAKGFLIDVADSLNLMIDKIQDCIDKKIDLRYGTKTYEVIKFQKLLEWKDWFITNQEIYCINDFYEIINGERLQGVKFFEGQSLNKPLPASRDELMQYLTNINKLLISRGKMMYKSIH